MIIESLSLFLRKIMFFTAYVNNTSSFPKPLNSKEEAEYLEKFQNGDMKAKEILIHHNLRLVAHIVKKYSGTEEADDLISAGSLGLIKAINTYKPTKGTRLATYAAKCIENEVLMHFRSTKKLAVEVSLSDSLDMDGEGNSLSFLDVLSCDDIRLDRIENLDTEEALYKLINTRLEPREREIIIQRYGLYDVTPKTQHEIAEKCNISRSYVSRIEKRALEKLKEGFDKK